MINSMILVNLLPWRLRIKKQQTAKLNAWMSCSVLMGSVVACGMYLHVTAKLNDLNAAYDDVYNEMKRCEQAVSEISQLQQYYTTLDSKIAQIKALQLNRYLVHDFFDELVTILPKQLYLTSIQRVKNHVTLQGIAASPLLVTHVLHQIERHAWMSHPRILEMKNVSVDEPSSERSQHRFKLTLMLRRHMNDSVSRDS